MPRRDSIHNAVRHALELDGWVITHDPYVLPFGEQNLFVDLGAEVPIAAEKLNHKIAVEVKSFLSASAVSDLERAIGQYALYDFVMKREDPERILYLAVTRDTYDEVLNIRGAREVVSGLKIRLMIFDLELEQVIEWKD